MMHRLLLWIAGLWTLAASASVQLEAPNFSQPGDTPWVVMVTQPGCHFCERLERDILQPLRASKRFADHVRYTAVDIGLNPQITDFTGDSISARTFAERYQAFGTPTLLFLSADGQVLSEPRYGLPDAIDFYAYAVEQTIESILAP